MRIEFGTPALDESNERGVRMLINVMILFLDTSPRDSLLLWELESC